MKGPFGIGGSLLRVWGPPGIRMPLLAVCAGVCVRMVASELRRTYSAAYRSPSLVVRCLTCQSYPSRWTANDLFALLTASVGSYIVTSLSGITGPNTRGTAALPGVDIRSGVLVGITIVIGADQPAARRKPTVADHHWWFGIGNTWSPHGWRPIISLTADDVSASPPGPSYRYRGLGACRSGRAMAVAGPAHKAGSSRVHRRPVGPCHRPPRPVAAPTHGTRRPGVPPRTRRRVV